MNSTTPSNYDQASEIKSNITLSAEGRPHSRPKSAKQRRFLFEVWEKTGDVKEACRQARVSLRTFYYWKPRFQAGGYAALDKTLSHAPKNPNRISRQLETQIISLKEQNPAWGKMRIAKTISQLHNNAETVSPNTVRRVLMDAGLWSSAEPSMD